MSEPTKSASRHTLHYAWTILFAMCVIRSLSAAGINNTGGLFLSPVSTDLGVGVGNLSIYFSISSVATMVTLPFAGKLIGRFGIRAMILSAAILQTLSFMSLGWMDSVWGWYVMSIPMGVGGAILINLAGPLLVNRWFQDSSGTALGIMMASVGVFGAVIQPLVIRTITSMGWRKTYFFMGAAFAVIILLVGVLFIRNAPVEKGLQPYISGKAVKQKAESMAAVSIPKAHALKSSAFALLLIFMVAITAIGAYSQHLATYGYSLGYGEAQMSTALSISMLGSTVGAILIGYLSDKLGVFHTTLGILAAAAAALACLLFGGCGIIIFTLGGFLLGLAAMGIPVLAPLLTRTYFGGDDYESIYAAIMMGPPFATVLLLPLYGFLYDLTGSYLWVLVILGAFLLIGTLCTLWGWRAKNKLTSQSPQ